MFTLLKASKDPPLGHCSLHWKRPLEDIPNKGHKQSFSKKKRMVRLNWPLLPTPYTHRHMPNHLGLSIEWEPDKKMASGVLVHPQENIGKSEMRRAGTFSCGVTAQPNTESSFFQALFSKEAVKVGNVGRTTSFFCSISTGNFSNRNLIKNLLCHFENEEKVFKFLYIDLC